MIAKPMLRLMIAGSGSILFASIAMGVRAVPAAAPDPVRGGKLFLQCAACHSATPGAPNSIGPNLTGIVGAKAATRPGYNYSSAMQKSGLVWDAATLDAFLKRPTQKVPGTKMGFGGLADPKSRADVIAYLTTLKVKR